MGYYTKNADTLARQYNSLDPEQVHSSWLHYLPKEPGLACDIGAGSGRDALWLSERGWIVTAAEPSEALLKRAATRTNTNITWLSDTLPDLRKVQTHRQGYGLILISAVWMHLTQVEQSAALDRVIGLLAQNGILVITWRNQADDPERQFETVDESLFQGAEIICSEDIGGRKSVEWKTAILRANSP